MFAFYLKVLQLAHEMREYELRTNNVRYINGQIKVFIVDFVDPCTAKVLVDGRMLKVKISNLSAIQH